MKVALISLCENSANKALYFPIGLLEISDILDELGINNKIIDINRLKNDGDFRTSILNVVKKEKYDFIGFYTRCDIFPYVLSISKEIKENNKNILIFLGGPEASALPIEYMKEFNFIDMIFVGESEVTVREYFSAIAKKEKNPHIPGLALRKGNEIIFENRDELINDLDSLNPLNFQKISDYDLSPLPVEIGRGCPYNCIFCSTSVFWKRNYRFKSAQKIVSELSTYINKYNTRNFYFIHDNILAKKSSIISLCEEIIRNKVNIEWECSGRIDNIDDEIVKLMQCAGCKSIYFGIETGSPNMQYAIGKKINISQINTKLDIMDKYNVNCILSFIIGFPDETLDDIAETFKTIIFSKQHKCVYYVQIHHLTVNTGTKLYDEYCDKLINNEDLRVLSDQVRSVTGRVFNKNEQRMIKRNINLFPSYHSLPYAQSFFNNISALAMHLMYISNNYYKPIFAIGKLNANVYEEIILYLTNALKKNIVTNAIDHHVLFELIKKYYLDNKYIKSQNMLLAILIHEKLYLIESDSDICSTNNIIILDNVVYEINMLSIIARFKSDTLSLENSNIDIYYLFCKTGNTINRYECSKIHLQILAEIKNGHNVEVISTKYSLPKIIIRNTIKEFVNIGVLKKIR